MRLTTGFALLVMRSAIVRFLRVPGARNGAGAPAPRPDQGRAHDAMLPPRSGWTPPPAADRDGPQRLTRVPAPIWVTTSRASRAGLPTLVERCYRPRQSAPIVYLY